MKTIYLYAAIALAAVFSLQSCDDGYKHYEGVYISSTLGTTPMSTVVLRPDVTTETPQIIDITVSTTDLLGADITVQLNSDPTLVDKFNSKYGTLYTALPSECYSILPSTVTIGKGSFANSTPVQVVIKSVEGLSETLRYMIPVNIERVDGYGIIDASRTLYLALTQVIVSNALDFQNSRYAAAYFGRPAAGVSLPYDVGALTKFTCEARVFSRSVNTNGLNTIFGLEENFCIRLAKENNKKGELELTGGGISANIMTPDPFPTNAWTHLAVVWDGDASGKGRATIYINGEAVVSREELRSNSMTSTINLHSQYMQAVDLGEGAARFEYDDAPFWISKSERSRYLNGAVSEVKLWAKALTASEVRANMCITDPESDMLISYWRFNEGGDDGITFKDLTGHGFDMKLKNGSAGWMNDIKCPENY